MKKVLLITGGSDGIGATTAYLAADQGFTVCINYVHNKTAAERIVDDIRKKGGDAYSFQADVSDESQVEKLFKAIDEEVGTISALVNNAGIIVQPQQTLSQMSAARLRKVFDVNVIGCFLCAREAVKRMSSKHNGSGGVIVNVSSMASQHGSPFEYIDYASTKGALDTMTVGTIERSCRRRHSRKCSTSRIIKTDIHRKAGDPNRPERLKDMIPMKRPGEPEEVAKTILWLLSDDASYITGALVNVSGGR
jgi:NAD(P)-dependent dehydrogenase (short-subunit alcohol dehydrogenase family)